MRTPLPLLAIAATLAATTLPVVFAPAPAAAAGTVVQAPARPGAQPINTTDRVYTADQTSNTVTVINPATNAVLGTLALGDQRLSNTLGPQYLRDVDVHGLGFSRDGRYLNVISVTSNTVTVIRTIDNSVVSRTTVGRAAHEGFFAPNGKTVWVADRALARLDIVDALHGGIVGSVRTADGPSKVLFSPDGSLAYVNHLRSGTIDVISVGRRAVVRRITGLADTFSSDMALSADGKQLWVAHKKVGKSSVVDVVHSRVIAVLTTGANTNHPAYVTTPAATYVYVTVGGENVTKVYEERPGQPIRLAGTIASSGVEPHGIWPSPDNSRVYVVNEKSDTVDVISTGSRTILRTLHVGQEGQALVYVAGAVPSGTGRQHLGRQGLGQPVVNAPVRVELSPGSAQVNVRAVHDSDQLEVSAKGLTPSTPYTAYGRRNGDLVPLTNFSSDAHGAVPQALAFLKVFGVYDVNDITVRPRSAGMQTPQISLTSAEPGDAVAMGDGRPGAGSPDGAGFAINVKIVTPDGMAPADSEGLNIRHTDALGSPNPDLPGLVVTVDNTLTKPDGGTIPAGTNLASLFNISGSDDSPGPGVTVWAGWHVLESLAPSTTDLTVTATITDTAGRRNVTHQHYNVTSSATSGQALTPAPAAQPTTTSDATGPELDLVSPSRDTSVALGTLPQPTPKNGSLFFVQLDAVDAAHHGLAVDENASGAGQIVDPTQIKAGGPNRNAPGLFFSFDAALRQPNGNLIPAGQNLAPLFNVAGSTVTPSGAIHTTFDWVVGGSLVLPTGQDTLTMTARVTDIAGGASITTRRVSISPVTSGQDLTPQPS